MGSCWAKVTELWQHMLCKLLCTHGDLAAGDDWTSGFCNGTRGQCLACNHVSQLYPWCALQQGWRHEGRQRDVCEYIMFILQKCQDTPFRGSWEARVMCPHGIHVADSGSCEAAIALEPSVAGHWTLQDAVHEWHHQAHINALKDVPQWLVLRVNRFQQDASGGANKIRSAMGWTPELRIPAFRDATLNVIEVRYRLRACIVHLGEHVMTGHYRALLVRDADEVDGNELRYCDDGIKAKPLSGFGVLASDVCVCFSLSVKLHHLSSQGRPCVGICMLDCKLNLAFLLHLCVDMNHLSTGSQQDWPLVLSMSDVLSQDARRFGAQKKKNPG